MTDITEESSNATVEDAEPPKPPTMAETQEQPQGHVAVKSEKTMTNVSFSIWPPSQRTRDAVINRLIESLSSPSVLSKRYGSIPADVASDVAREIEDEAFASASASASADDDGIEILQAYSKEISKRMLDAVKSKSGSGSGSGPASVDPSPTAGEGTPSVETES